MKASSRKQRLIAEINITPFTDVILVLLIIFMITTPLIIQSSIKVSGAAIANPAPKNLRRGFAPTSIGSLVTARPTTANNHARFEGVRLQNRIGSA